MLEVTLISQKKKGRSKFNSNLISKNSLQDKIAVWTVPLIFISAVYSVFLYYSDDIPKHGEVLIPYIALTVFYTINRIVNRYFVLLRIVSLILLIYSLLLGYIIPIFNFLVIILIPLIMLEMILIFPWPYSLITESLIGLVSPLFISNIKSILFINNENYSIPIYFLIFCLFSPLIITFGLLSYAINRKLILEKELILKDLQNKRLMAINSEINTKLYVIQQDSSQEERMRITKEIHDTAGYVFINVIMLLQAATALFDKDFEKGKEKVDFALDYVRRGMNEIRFILREIRVYEKPSFGLPNEMYDIVNLFIKATGLKVKLEYGNWPKSFGKKEDEFFCSLLQESLTNVIKHGSASSVNIICWSASNTASIIIQDNGGIKQSQIILGIGITGIIDFAKSINGSVKYGFNKLGFELNVSIPIE